MNIDAVELVEFYEKCVDELMSKPPDVKTMDMFNASIQDDIETPYRDAAVKTELAQLKLKAARWFHEKQGALGR